MWNENKNTCQGKIPSSEGCRWQGPPGPQKLHSRVKAYIQGKRYKIHETTKPKGNMLHYCHIVQRI